MTGGKIGLCMFRDKLYIHLEPTSFYSSTSDNKLKTMIHRPIDNKR